jgi:hypothetical protein
MSPHSLAMKLTKILGISKLTEEETLNLKFDWRRLNLSLMIISQTIIWVRSGRVKSSRVHVDLKPVETCWYK